jgi:DUF1365 family protein
MPIPEAAIYAGKVRHRRYRPVQHEFAYNLFMAFVDIDTIPALMRQSAVSSYNRWNWASFHEKDHLGDPSLPLRERLRRDAAAQGADFPDGPVFLLTHLRYLGYCFNPISLYYCYGKSGELGTILAEVNSTFGEHRNYWLGDHNRLESGPLRFHSAKSMHVSPFMDLKLDYDFTFTEPSRTLVAHMNTLDGGGSFFDATLTLERQPWTSANLALALARQPFMTAKVIAAIHWEALRLWIKGAPVYQHPTSGR